MLKLIRWWTCELCVNCCRVMWILAWSCTHPFRMVMRGCQKGLRTNQICGSLGCEINTNYSNIVSRAVLNDRFESMSEIDLFQHMWILGRWWRGTHETLPRASSHSTAASDTTFNCSRVYGCSGSVMSRMCCAGRKITVKETAGNVRTKLEAVEDFL